MEDRHLWEKAKDRIAFKRHLNTYLIANALFWLIWIIGNVRTAAPFASWSFPWPIYPLIGWGIALAFHYLSAFKGRDEKATQRAYESKPQSRSRYHPDYPSSDYHNVPLYNATVVGENPEASFIIEGERLHALEPRVASLRSDSSTPGHVLSALREALRELVQFSEGKVPPHFVNIDWSSVSDDPASLISKIHQIYYHLPHQDRNHLSSLIHHSQLTR
jgi:hypothetical protein